MMSKSEEGGPWGQPLQGSEGESTSQVFSATVQYVPTSANLKRQLAADETLCGLVINQTSSGRSEPLQLLATNTPGYHVRRVFIHLISHPPIYWNAGLLSPCIKPEISSSGRLLPKRQCREQGAKAVQSKCSQARQRYGIGKHRASPTLLYKDGANHQEGVRHFFVSRDCPT